MSQDVNYADLKFVRTPLPKKNQQEEANEAELNYENIKPARRGEEASPSYSEHPKDSGRRALCTCVALGAAFLFLLATAIGFGVSYWQISKRVQEVSQSHTANSSLLGRRIQVERGRLAQSQQELRKAEMAFRSTLWETWLAGNKTERRLQQLEGELRRAKSVLARVQEEKAEAERKMSWAQREQNQSRSCPQIGCCPSGWKLFRWKCLRVSQQWKSWQESKKDCLTRRSSQLLILRDPWNVTDLWNAGIITESRYPYSYWIGLRKKEQRFFALVSSSTWYWMDGSEFEGTVQSDRGDCVRMIQGDLRQTSCERRLAYICEKAAKPTALT